MLQSQFRPGFRLSPIDVFVLIVGSAAVIVAAPLVPSLRFVVPFVVLHFFLFCNVFRISRVPELIWAALFLALAGSTISLQTPGWAATAATMICTTVVLIALEMRKASYHGVGWQRINPGLRDWWEANVVRRASE